MTVTLPPATVSAGDANHASDHNTLRKAVADIDGQYGMVDVDSFTAGANDDDKLDLAATYAMQQTRHQVLQLRPKSWTFTRNHTYAYDNFYLVGPAGVSQEEYLSGSTGPTRVKVDIAGGVFLTLSGRSARIYNISFDSTNLTTTFLAGATLKYAHLHNLQFSSFYGVLGDASRQLLMLGVTTSGWWNINNGVHTDCNIGGSDNNLWTDGCLWDSNRAWKSYRDSGTSLSGKYALWLQGMEKTSIGDLYLTARGRGAIKVTEGTTKERQGPTVIKSARIEGTNSGSGRAADDRQCFGALINIAGSGLVLQNCWLGWAMADYANGANSAERGFVHQTGGRLTMNGCTVGYGYRADDTTPVNQNGAFFNGTYSGSTAVPLVYSSGGDCMVSQQQCYQYTGTRGNGTAWTERPLVYRAGGSSFVPGNLFVVDESVRTS